MHDKYIIRIRAIQREKHDNDKSRGIVHLDKSYLTIDKTRRLLEEYEPYEDDARHTSRRRPARSLSLSLISLWLWVLRTEYTRLILHVPSIIANYSQHKWMQDEKDLFGGGVGTFGTQRIDPRCRPTVESSIDYDGTCETHDQRGDGRGTVHF